MRLTNSIAVIIPTAEGVVLQQLVEQLSLVEKIKTLNSITNYHSSSDNRWIQLSLAHLCTSAWGSCRYTCNISRAHELFQPFCRNLSLCATQEEKNDSNVCESVYSAYLWVQVRTGTYSQQWTTSSLHTIKWKKILFPWSLLWDFVALFLRIYREDESIVTEACDQSDCEFSPVNAFTKLTGS